MAKRGARASALPEVCDWCGFPLPQILGVCRIAIRTACGDLLHLKCWIDSTTEAQTPTEPPDPGARRAPTRRPS